METLFLIFLLFLHFPLSMCQISALYAAVQGDWQLLHESIGISAMHMQLLHNNKVVIFDRTDFGPSRLPLPSGRCRYDPNDIVLKRDCTAHSVLYDINTNAFRPLMVQTDTWCSSGSVLPDGTLVQTGGYNDGDHAVRVFSPCFGDSCDWTEFPHSLSQRRWYATNQLLPDGRIIIVGGRGQFNYEFYPNRGLRDSRSSTIPLEFLRETRDENENNLYPFLHLLQDGNLFILANTRSILFDYKQNKVVKEFPPIPGGEPRNYPSSGSSVLLPIDENAPIQAEILVCGGAPHQAFRNAARGSFLRASSTCGRLRVTDVNPIWKMEKMPMPRVMGDMLLLPNGEVIIINGATLGTAGWESARDPMTRPLIYKPYEVEINSRFSVMQASLRPRMYHSSAILLIDGRILVGGSNPHVFYNFTGVEYPTDLSLEAFFPPYLSAIHEAVKPIILHSDENLQYQKPFSVTFVVGKFLEIGVVSIRIMAPSFTTHSFSMNQRMVVLRMVQFSAVAPGTYRVAAFGPSKAEIAPPGYYMLFAVHASIPSHGVWVKLG